MTYILVDVLEPGDAGTDRTLREMARLAREAAPLVPRWLPRDPVGIRAYLRDTVRFRHDPPGQEVVMHPLGMLDAIRRDGHVWGDCDDAAVLGAAMGLAGGLQPVFRVVGFSEDGPFAHVWTELQDARTGELQELDIFRPQQLPRGSKIRRDATVEV